MTRLVDRNGHRVKVGDFLVCYNNRKGEENAKYNVVGAVEKVIEITNDHVTTKELKSLGTNNYEGKTWGWRSEDIAAFYMIISKEEAITYMM